MGNTSAVQEHSRPNRWPVVRRCGPPRARRWQRLPSLLAPGLTQLRKTLPPQTPTKVHVRMRTLRMPQHIQNQGIRLPAASRSTKQTPVRWARQQLPLIRTHVNRHKTPACNPVLRSRHRTGLSIFPRQDVSLRLRSFVNRCYRIIRIGNRQSSRTR